MVIFKGCGRIFKLCLFAYFSMGQVDQETDLFFPYSQMRPEQDKLIHDLHAAFDRGKILLAHAPTGLGKTAGALAVAVKHALEKDKRVFFLTHRHTQHQIALETLKLVQGKSGKVIRCADLIGKRWMCSHDVAGLYGNEFSEFCKTMVERGECEFYNKVRTRNSLQVEAKLLLKELQKPGPLSTEEVMVISKGKGMCSYEIALALAKEAQVIIGDYNYVFNPFVQNTLFSKMGITPEDVILIVDEAHNLPGRVTEMLSSNLTTVMLRNSIVEAKKYGNPKLASWLQELARALIEWAVFPKDQDKERKVNREEFLQKAQRVANYDELLHELEVAADEVREKQHKSYLGGIASFLSSWKGEDQGYARIISQRDTPAGPVITLSYLCLDPSIITRSIFNSIHAGVLMSGTLKPTFMYKDLLGIEQGIEQEYQSPFPLENKKTIIIPETTTRYSLRGEAMYQRIAEKCTELALLIPGNVAFFFPSYGIRDKIGQYLNGTTMNGMKRVFWEKREMSKEEKERLLAQFREEYADGGVLLGVAGANFAEGIDLPGEFLNGVVVVGLPLAKPDLLTKERIGYYDYKFSRGWDYGYVYPAMNKCMQSAGRCIRSETDKGAIIYLDERFAWPSYFCCFPREGLVVSKGYEKLLKEFFGKKV